MKKLIFATNNESKLREVREILKDEYEVLGLKDLNITEDIEETGSTFRENAQIKSTYIYEKYGIPCFSDDSGLVVDILGGDPGVYSSRYSDPKVTGISDKWKSNNFKLLSEICYRRVVDGDNSPLTARFITSISYTSERGTIFFDGVVEGDIIMEPRGDHGFSYDSVFVPSGEIRTFAEMGDAEKNSISHRRRALDKFVKYLDNE